MDIQQTRAAGRRSLSFASLLSTLVLPALLLPTLPLVGCEKGAEAPTKSIAERSDTPEAQLDNVMRRLEYALDQAKPVPGSGVISTRKASSKLIPPAEGKTDYAAEITITTSTTLAAEEVERLKGAGDEQQADAAKGAGGQADAVEVQAAEKIADEAKTSEQKVYKLAYKNDRWELAEPIDEMSGTEKICFQYALSDG